MTTDEEIKKWAWENATIVEGCNPSITRKDPCGAWIAFDKFDVTENLYGWKIDNILPISKGGKSIKENVRAMQHNNIDSKGNMYPFYKAVITSKGNDNIECSYLTSVNKIKQKELSQIFETN